MTVEGQISYLVVSLGIGAYVGGAYFIGIGRRGGGMATPHQNVVRPTYVLTPPPHTHILIT